MRPVAVLALILALQITSASAFAYEQHPGDWRPSSLILRHETRYPVLDPVIEAGAFRMAVPFRTQKDGTPWQGSNCGPAVLGMVLDGFGQTGQSTDDLRFRAHTYQGTVGMRTGTALDHVAHVAEDFGVHAYGLYGADGAWRSWTVDDIREQLRLGRPVMPLVRLYLLPTYENSLPRWGHYILVTGMTESGFFYSDPLQLDAVNGTGGYMSADRLMRAMQGSHIPGQAVAFGSSAMLSWSPAS